MSNKKNVIYSRRLENSSRMEKPKQQPKKNKKAMIILWLLFVFWTIGSVLSLFNFTKSLVSVKADTITKYYTFEGSNITIWGDQFRLYYVNPSNNKDYMHTTDYSNASNGNYFPSFSNNNCLVNYRFSFSDVDWFSDKDNVTRSTEMIFCASYVQYASAKLKCYAYGTNTFNPVNSNEPENDSYSVVLGNNSLVNFFMVVSDLNYNQFIRVTRSSYDFSCDIVRLEMGNSRDIFAPAIIISNGANPYQYKFYYNFIRYYDSNDNFLEIAIPVFYNYDFMPQALLTNRSYIISDKISDSVIYKLAEFDGYSAGFDYGKPIGIEEGYQLGLEDGYDIGYAEGVLKSNEYTWLGLMSTVIQAPVTAILGEKNVLGLYESGLFSIEILGINLSNFFAGIFTLTLLLALVRMILRKG